MPVQMKLWGLSPEGPIELQRSAVDTEADLEDWIAKDPSILSPDLLIIGRQVETAYGGFIDLLGMDPSGNLVVIELKRDRTPREVVAQALDYASWVRRLSHEEIERIVQDYLGQELEEAFQEKFNSSLPDVVNESHNILIVAAELDPATERIVKYLSEEHGVPINVAFFSVFEDGSGRKFLARSWLMEPEEVEIRVHEGGRRPRRPLSYEEFRRLAHQNGVGELYDRLVEGLRRIGAHLGRTSSNVAFRVEHQGSRRVFLSLYPGLSSQTEGLLGDVRPELIAQAWRLPLQAVEEAIPPGQGGEAWHQICVHGRVCYFRSIEDVERFLTLLPPRERTEGGDAGKQQGVASSAR